MYFFPTPPPPPVPGRSLALLCFVFLATLGSEDLFSRCLGRLGVRMPAQLSTMGGNGAADIYIDVRCHSALTLQ